VRGFAAEDVRAGCALARMLVRFFVMGALQRCQSMSTRKWYDTHTMPWNFTMASDSLDEDEIRFETYR